MLKLKKYGHEDFFKLWGQLRDLLYHTPEYQTFLLEVRARCSGMCTADNCTKRGHHVHHIVRVYDDPRLCTKVENGTYLCVKCHNKIHSKGKKKKSSAK